MRRKNDFTTEAQRQGENLKLDKRSFAKTCFSPCLRASVAILNNYED
jgi:hypothetical protein